MHGHRYPLTVLNTDKYDRRLYASLQKKTEKLREMEERLNREEMPLANIMLQDLWAGLYKSQPEVLEEVVPELQVNRQIMQEAIKLPKFEDLRQFTILDELGAALGAVVLGEKVAQLIPPMAHEAFKLTQRAQQLMEQAAGMREISATQKGNTTIVSKYQEEAAVLEKEAEVARQHAQKKIDLATQVMAKQIKDKVVKKSLKAALDNMREKLEAASLFWGTTPGVSQAINSEAKFQLAQRLLQEPKLWQIAKKAGRMTRIALHKCRTKVKKVPQTVTGITQGNDLSRVLPAELHLLAHPIARKDFLRRFTEGKLLQYELKGKEILGRGPIIACIDSSGSMHGEREIWAKAVALALFQVAVKEKRAFAWINFSTSACSRFQCADPRQVNLLQLAEAAAESCGGGTNFEEPLEEAMNILAQSEFKRGDIIFITDGKCQLGETFLQRFIAIKHKKDFSVYTVLINSQAQGAHDFSDNVAYFDGIDDTNALHAAFSGL